MGLTEISKDAAWCVCVNGNLEGGEFPGDALGKATDSELACGVCCKVQASALAKDGGGTCSGHW